MYMGLWKKPSLVLQTPPISPFARRGHSHYPPTI